MTTCLQKRTILSSVESNVVHFMALKKKKRNHEASNQIVKFLLQNFGIDMRMDHASDVSIR